MKTAIKIGCVVFGILALVTTSMYFVQRRKKTMVIEIKPEVVNEEPKQETKKRVMDSKEFVARLRERKKNK